MLEHLPTTFNPLQADVFAILALSVVSFGADFYLSRLFDPSMFSLRRYTTLFFLPFFKAVLSMSIWLDSRVQKWFSGAVFDTSLDFGIHGNNLPNSSMFQ